MKKIILWTALASLSALSACGEAATNITPPESHNAAQNSANKISGEQNGSTAVSDLSKMEIPDIIDFVDEEAKSMSALLETVTDGASAEAAVADIRTTIPRLNAAILSLKNMDTDNVKLSIGTMRKMLTVAQSQAGLFTEIQRISQIPEARAVLEKEFDKIEILK